MDNLPRPTRTRTITGLDRAVMLLGDVLSNGLPVIVFDLFPDKLPSRRTVVLNHKLFHEFVQTMAKHKTMSPLQIDTRNQLPCKFQFQTKVFTFCIRDFVVR